MWSSFLGILPPGLVMLCTILSFVVPFGIYLINKLLHMNGDPPWKQQDEKELEDSKPPQSQP